MSSRGAKCRVKASKLASERVGTANWEAGARSSNVERFADEQSREPEGVNWRRETPPMEICLASRTSGTC